MRLAIAMVVMLAASVEACSVPKISLRVSGNVDDCVVELKNPFFIRGVPEVETLELYRNPLHADTAPECRLVAEQDPAPLGKWQIGTVPSGYKLEKCAPLERGQEYTVSVHATAGLGARPFAVGPNGIVDNLGSDWK
jgi:hypothetical protein